MSGNGNWWDTYYLITYYPDGNHSFTRLLGVHDDKTAKRVVGKMSRQYPDLKFGFKYDP